MSLQERVANYETFVSEHQEYYTEHSDCVQWLITIQERLDSYADSTGDKHTVQNRLDRLQVGSVINYNATDMLCINAQNN